jgi:hypothetical protein
MESVSVESIIEAAKVCGKEDAEAAATWLEIADIPDAQWKLGMLDDGDPAVWEYLPNVPDLSGEFADGLTPESLMADRIGLIVWNRWETDDACSAYEDAVSEHFETAIEKRLRDYLAA